MFLIYIVGALILGAFGLYAQSKVKGSFKKYSRMGSSSALTGAEAARQMLRQAGVTNVEVQQGEGFLSDHYDPRKKVIRLSPEVYNNDSVASLGVACHEAGHALQEARQYWPMMIRNAAVPLAGFGSNAGIIILIAGILLQAQPLAILGLLLFGAVVFFQLVNLPVEFDASARAKRVLTEYGMVARGAESEGVDKVLDAAAMTYVAGTVSAVFTFLYYALLVFGGGRE